VQAASARRGHDEDGAHAAARGGAAGDAGAQHAAQAEAREQVAVAVVPKAQLAAEHEQQHGLGAVDGAGHDVGADQAPGDGLPEEGAGAFAQLAQHVGRVVRRARRREERPGRERRDGQRREREGRAVEREGEARRADEEQQRAEAGPGDDADLPDGRARRVGGGEVGVVDEARRGSGHARHVGAGCGGRERGDHRRQDDWQTGGRDAGQRQHEDEADGVGGDHQPPAVVAVGQDAAERAADDDRQDARGSRDAEPRRRVRALVHEGEQREVVEPVACLRDGQAGQQAAEAGIPASNVHGRRVCG
jgi:hypothetical protein